MKKNKKVPSKNVNSSNSQKTKNTKKMELLSIISKQINKKEITFIELGLKDKLKNFTTKLSIITIVKGIYDYSSDIIEIYQKAQEFCHQISLFFS